MKNLSYKPFILTLTVLFTTLILLSDVVYAGRGGGGRGGGGRGGGARTSSVQRSGGARSGGSRSTVNRGGGASSRVGSSSSLQNRGNFSNSRSQARQGTRQQNAGNRQGNRQQNQGDRQNIRNDRQGTRQDNAGNRQDNRQQNAGNRQDNRQQNASNRQDNRQDFRNNNWRGGGWYGGGYYAPSGWGAWTAAVGFTTGVILGATVSSPPPYYDTVYVGSNSYIYSDGVYLEPVNDSYTVISPPIGAVVNYLPDGCNIIQEENTQYYDCAGVYYETFYQNGATVYKVVQF
ncbi:hypothetical protein GM3708_271 [Geminocystis sp. NIES-3708]|uniref:DUF6515 family protein n=1 Tax=Geminocystis sp. NIES-3708 TaxID=1615909 RepID=UPI0005FCB90F|nr:DUF6515 family protein [Geminocystis sp. NIES-3708]BAQ59865.1 hypothetical protein GM3708_271 [Geminocystis sp. NIES-3708]